MNYIAEEIARMREQAHGAHAKVLALLSIPHEDRTPPLSDETLRSLCALYEDETYIDKFIEAQKDRFDTRPYSMVPWMRSSGCVHYKQEK